MCIRDRGDRVGLVDDWFETGSQGLIARQLIEAAGATYVGASIIFSALRIDPVKSSETWLAPELISAERMMANGSPGQCRRRWNRATRWSTRAS